MKKMIAIMAIALMLGQSPFCYAGISHDKAMHIGASKAAEVAEDLLLLLLKLLVGV